MKNLVESFTTSKDSAKKKVSGQKGLNQMLLIRVCIFNLR